MHYLKRAITLYKENRLSEQILFRLKTFLSLPFSKQRKGFFDLI